MARGCLALTAVALFLGQAFAAVSGNELSSAEWELPRGGTRALLGESDHKYKMHDPIKLYANKVGPFSNPRYVTFTGNESTSMSFGGSIADECLPDFGGSKTGGTRAVGLGDFVANHFGGDDCNSVHLTGFETYQYYTLPFCTPKEGKEYKPEGLGEVLEGDRLVNTPYDIKFRVDKENEDLCSRELTVKDLKKLRMAVKKDYYFQMFYDDLPIWGFIGKTEKIMRPGEKPALRFYLFTHIHFDIHYHENRVIEVNVSTDPARTVDITGGEKIIVDYTYSVSWRETPTTFDKRMEKYSRYSFLPQHLEIHWFSIVNSCVTVLLLTGFLATILMRVLKADFIKYTRDDEAAEEQEETGWKYIHGDVFRPPPHLNLFAACVGTGTQILAMAVAIFALALVGVFYPYNRGALLTACVVLYALTAGIAGYVAAVTYKILGGTSWVRNTLLTATLFCGPLLVTFSFLNTVAIVYRSTAALPFGTIVIILVIWAAVTFPLTVLGGIAGKNSKMEFNAPTRTTKYSRKIPPLPWYRHTLPQMLMAGFLPFSAIYIELYYIFASVWGHKVYTIYSILALVFVILIVVTAFIVVALTYFQLAVEDHQWWWRSFLCGGSTGLFIFGYTFYYYFCRSDMSGFMQTSFYFGYMSVVCYAFLLMLGTVGFRASLTFVRHIYRAIKCE